MKTVGAYEAKTHLAELLDQVGAGESITVTRHGVPVARLCPPPDQPDSTVEETIREIRRFRQTHSLGGLAVKDMIEEGHR
jgi:prevent-host-death family protein